MNPNINQIYQKILKNLSFVSLGVGVFNTINNLGTINKLRDNLEIEREVNNTLSAKMSNLISENESNTKLEVILRKSLDIQENNSNKLETLNSKIKNISENKTFDESSIIEVNNTMKEINKELLEIINKIDDCLTNEFTPFDIFNQIQTYYNTLNFFQTLAITHIFAIILIFILLIDLMSIYFSDYLIERFNTKEKYPRIYKLLEIRRKFRIFYLIKDFIIILIALIALLYINILLFKTFTL